MIAINRKRFIISCLMVLLSTSLIIIIGIKQQMGHGGNMSLHAQNILYWGIIVLVIQVGIGISLFRNHINLVNDIKKISRIGDLSHHHSQKILAGMGVLGREIESMIGEQNALVVLRSNRISALNTLVRMLCNGYGDPIIITDVNGVVLSLSDVLSNRLKKDGVELMGEDLKDYIPDINLPEVLSFLEKQRLPWSNNEKKSVVCTPIFDKANLLNFCIWELETDLFTNRNKEKQENNRKQKNQKVARSIINRFTKKK